MYFVYILRSISFPDKLYVGYTNDITRRIDAHNNGGSIYTEKYRPWILLSYTLFMEESKAIDFEKYLKSGSGKAFAKKHYI